MPNPHDISTIDTSPSTAAGSSQQSPLALTDTNQTVIRPSRLHTISSPPPLTSTPLSQTDLYPNLATLPSTPTTQLALPTTDKTVALLATTTSTPTRARSGSLSTLSIPQYHLQPDNPSSPVTFYSPQTHPKDLAVKRKFRKDRSRSEESPRSSSDDDLDKTASEFSPEHKRQVTSHRDLLKDILVSTYQELFEVQAQYQARKHGIQNAANDQRIKALEASISQKTDELNTIQDKLLKAEFAVSNLAKRGLLAEASATAAIELAKTQSDDLFTQLAATTEEKDRLAQKLEEIQTGLREFYEFEKSQLVQAHERNTTAFHTAIYQRDNEIRSLRAELTNNAADRSTQEKQLLAPYENEIGVLTTTVQTHQTRIQSLLDDGQQIQYQRDQIKSDLELAVRSNKEAEAEISTLRTNNDALQNANYTLNEEIRTAHSNLAKAQLHAQDLQAELDSEQTTIINLRQSEKSLIDQVTALSQGNFDVASVTQSYQSQISLRDSEIQNLQSHISKLKDDYYQFYSHLEHKFQFSEKELINARSNITTLDHDLKNARQIIAQKQTALDLANQTIQRHQQSQTLVQPSTGTISLQQNRQQSTMALGQTGEDLLRSIAVNLAERTSQETRKAITPYNGYSSDKSIAKWVRHAEKIADLHSWVGDDKKKAIGSRLKGPAMSWHVERLRSHANEDFDDWKTALIRQFQLPADLEKNKLRFENLRQEKDQPTKYFVDRIKSLYHEIYGTKVPDPVIVQPGQQAPADPTKELRESVLLKVFMKGLNPTIKDAMWNGRIPPDYDWYQATQAAIDTEKLLISREVNAGPTVNSLVPANSPFELLVMQQQQEIRDLKTALNTMSLNNTGRNSGQQSEVAAITNYRYSRPGTRGDSSLVFQEPQFNSSFNSSNASNRGRTDSRERPRSNSFRRDKPYERRYSSDRNRTPERGRPRSPAPFSSNTRRERSFSGNREQNNNTYHRGNSGTFDRSRSTSQNRDKRSQPFRNQSKSPRRPSNDRYPSRDRGTQTDHSETICNRCENKEHIAAECRTQYPRKFRSKN